MGGFTIQEQSSSLSRKLFDYLIITLLVTFEVAEEIVTK